MKKTILTLDDAIKYIEELEDKVEVLEIENNRLESDVDEYGERLQEAKNKIEEMEQGLVATIDTGLDTVRIYQERGNLRNRQLIEYIAEGLSQPNTLPELFN